MKAIKKELGEDEGNVELAEMRKRVEEAKLSGEAKTAVDKEMRKLSQMNSASP